MEGIVDRTIKSGAELLTGGERANSIGYFFRPTIFKNVLPAMEIAQEEVFVLLHLSLQRIMKRKL